MPDHEASAIGVRPASVTELLEAWRAAERRWERRAPEDEIRRSALEVVSAWAAYQNAALPSTGGEFLLVADAEGVYVEATEGVFKVLGYRPSEIVGLRVDDIAAPELRAGSALEWGRFMADGRQDGQYRLVAKDGRHVALRYQARAHHPVPGFHVSRLWPDEDVADPQGSAT